MTSLVERIKHRNRNPDDKLLEDAAKEIIRLESRGDRRNKMLLEILHKEGVVLPHDLRDRISVMVVDNEI